MENAKTIGEKKSGPLQRTWGAGYPHGDSWKPYNAKVIGDLTRAGLSPAETLLVMTIQSYVRPWDAAAPFPSAKVLGGALGRSECVVRVMLRSLEARGFIARTQGPGRSKRIDLSPLMEKMALARAGVAALPPSVPVAAVPSGPMTLGQAVGRLERGGVDADVVTAMMPSVRKWLKDNWSRFAVEVLRAAEHNIGWSDSEDGEEAKADCVAARVRHFDEVHRRLAWLLLPSNHKPWEWTLEQVQAVVPEVVDAFRAVEDGEVQGVVVTKSDVPSDFVSIEVAEELVRSIELQDPGLRKLVHPGDRVRVLVVGGLVTALFRVGADQREEAAA